MIIPEHFFIFDVESIGLHGGAFAVAGGIYSVSGAAYSEFCFSCDPDKACGSDADRDWVAVNVPRLEITHRGPEALREAFWHRWLDAKALYPGIVMAAECMYPVETNFVAACAQDQCTNVNFGGPYPFHEIASIMLAAGMDPMATYERTPSEKPPHNPLADARLSARLLAEALTKLPHD